MIYFFDNTEKKIHEHNSSMHHKHNVQNAILQKTFLESHKNRHHNHNFL
jgi:hypothetical protein